MLENSWSRRKLLASIGITGAAALTGGMWWSSQTASAGGTVTQHVYGGEGSGGGSGGTACCHGFDYVVSDYGAVGDGIADDTAAIQAALDAVPVSGGTVYIPPGTYQIDALVSLYPRSRTNLLLANGAILKAIPNGANLYHIINIVNQTHVIVAGGMIVGDRDAHLGTTGEHGMGISVRSSQHVTIRDMEIRDCWGDGIYIGVSSASGRPQCKDVQILNVSCINNRRQGLSVTACIGGMAFGSRFNGTNGTAPESGIDVEPNGQDVVQHFAVVQCECSDNAGSGIAVYGTTDTNASGQLLQGNVCLRNTTGISIRGASSTKLVANTCSHNSGMGVRLGVNPHTVVNAYNELLGNTITDNGKDGIAMEGTATTQIHHNVCDRNQCRDNAEAAIRMSYVQYCQVMNNQLQGNQYGVRAIGATCQHNTVQGNLCIGNEQGIQIWGASFQQIQGNTCTQNRYHGISLRSASHRNTITGNCCIGNSQGAHGIYDNIIVMEESSSNNIQMNMAHKGTGAVEPASGIRVRSGCQFNIVANNELRDGGGVQPFVDQGTGTMTTSANFLV